MAFEHRPLRDEQLSPSVRQVVQDGAPAAMQEMVVEGIAPLPPPDLVTALYQFWVLGREPLASKAGKSIDSLPDAVLEGAIADAELAAGVLDFLARKSMNRDARLERIVRHPKVSNETLSQVAIAASESVCEIIAANQARWLAHPNIVKNLYQNRNCRMSLIHSVLELARRENLDVELPAMDEIYSTMEGQAVEPDRDELFSGTVSGHEEQERWIAHLIGSQADEDLDLSFMEIEIELLDEDKLQRELNAAKVNENRSKRLLLMKPHEKVRAALLGDRFDRALLVRDTNRMVAMATIKSPRIREDEVLTFSANRALSQDVLGYIAGRRDWAKLYPVKINLVMNPKTPLSKSMVFLGHLHGADVQKVARSKNIPAALATAARRRLISRR